MNLLSMVATVDQWLAEENTTVTVEPTACLHSWNKAATCDRCVQVCPVGALTVDGTIHLDESVCVQCGLCLPICPVGAFSGTDDTVDLLKTVAHLSKRDIVEMACVIHPQAEKGPSHSSAVLRSSGCLAALGTSAYLSLFALGVSHIVLRLDACADCPLGQVQPEIKNNLMLACQIATSETADATEMASLVTQIHPEWPERRVMSVAHPTRSRREFFKSLTTVDDLPPLVSQLIADEPQTNEKPLPRERRRLLAAWQLLPADERPMPSATALEALSFAHITADANCTACGLCARVCPTDALQLIVDNDKDNYQLAFMAKNCVDCGLCVALCEPGALHRQPPKAEKLLVDQPEILQQGLLQHCQRCKTSFAGSADSHLCPICTFRQQNPFGSRLIGKASVIPNIKN